MFIKFPTIRITNTVLKTRRRRKHLILPELLHIICETTLINSAEPFTFFFYFLHLKEAEIDAIVLPLGGRTTPKQAADNSQTASDSRINLYSRVCQLQF